MTLPNKMLAVAAQVLVVLLFTGIPLVAKAGPGIPKDLVSGELKSLRVHREPIVLPALSFQDGQGKQLTLADFRGKIVVLNLWATWCPPCVKELPSLGALQARFQDSGLVVLAISQDAAGNKVVPAFWAKLNLKRFSSYFDNEAQLTKVLRAPGLPTTLVLDGEGKEIARLVGSIDWASPQAVRLFEYLVLNR